MLARLGLIPTYLIEHDFTVYALWLLMLLVGISIGSDRRLGEILRTLRPRVLLLPMALCMLGHGVHQPCGQSGAVGPFPQAAGAASALNGFCMMVLAFGVGAVLGQTMTGHTLLPMALGMWFFGTWVALVAWTLVQKHGQPAHG